MTDEEYIKNISSISTEKLFNSLEYYGYDSYYADLLTATIEELKKRFEERPQGEWQLHGMIYYCSECGHECGESGDNFCGNCGAYMRVKDELNQVKDKLDEEEK